MLPINVAATLATVFIIIGAIKIGIIADFNTWFESPLLPWLSHLSVQRPLSHYKPSPG